MNENVSKSWKNMLICSLSIISAIFLIATLAVYVILPELRELQDKAMMAAVMTLAISYIVLSIQHLRPDLYDDYVICISFGIYNYTYNYVALINRKIANLSQTWIYEEHILKGCM